MEAPYTLEEVHKITTWFEVPSDIYEYYLDTCPSVEARKAELLALCYAYFNHVILKKETEIKEVEINEETVKLYIALCAVILNGMFKHSCSYYEKQPNSLNNVLTVLKQVTK